MSVMNGDDRLGHRQRLREKFYACPCDALPDYELLELVLTYAIPRRDVKHLAKELLARYHSFPGVLDAAPEELESIPGLGRNTATLLKLIRVANIRYLARNMEKLPLLNSPELFADYARTRLGDKKNEITLVFFLNSRHRLMFCDTLGSGSTDAVTVYPSEVARKSLLVGASAVVLSHNHPGGYCGPSPEDDALTFATTQALTPLGVKMLDHVIVTRFDFYSYRVQEQKANRVGFLSKLDEGELE
jgi:DNA repair protein RadC